jgi:NADH-ubiquinone oxidoreductase chain 5
MLLLILFFPLLGFLSGSLFGCSLGLGVTYITTLFTLLSFVLSIFTLFYIIKTGDIFIIKLMPWIYSDTLRIDWSFCFDSLTAVMLVIVTFISSLVHLYSTEYMENDPHLPRFMSYLSLFTFFMLILVTANNFLQMFVGWEGVGVSSYLLINFWFTRIQANKAAIKAMMVNRVGDFALLLAIFAIYFFFNSLDYDIVFTIAPFFANFKIIIGSIQVPIIDFICLFLFIGAMGKSAQLGLHTWLPDAMEGPTPVSALIHAATMVTAGVFLLTRCSYLFELSPFALKIVICIGSATAFFAATTGLFQNDMKRVIAYSTCSQLGYMIFACGLSSYEVGMFHLSNHAFFKALLFLGAGSVIHALSDEQDMRKMGGVQKLLPFSYAVMLIGSFALMGFPFLAGFYSKDVILETSYAVFSNFGHFAYILGTLAAFATAFYSIRLLYLVFLSLPNGNKNVINNAHEGTIKLTLPLFLLCILSILIGYLSKDLFIGFGADFWGSSMLMNPSNYLLSDIEFIDLFYKLLPFIITILGALSSFLIYKYAINYYLCIKKTPFFKKCYNFFNKKWYFDRIYNQFVSQESLKNSYHFFYKTIDRGILEKIGPHGLISYIIYFVKKIKSYQSGHIIDYLIYFMYFLFFFALIITNLSSTFGLFTLIFYLVIGLFLNDFISFLKNFVK